MEQTLRIGCVPYLNGKPLIEWFHSPDCSEAVDVRYDVPSQLARYLREGSLDVALVSTFEQFVHPELQIVPGISIAADGPVQSVRLFSKVPFPKIRSVALDTSSLTSAALVRILLADCYGIHPVYRKHPPQLDAMLGACDAALIIGDLKLFETPAQYIMDLGAQWKELTGLPFVYAAWLARPGLSMRHPGDLLCRAKVWGIRSLESITRKWAEAMELPEERVREYFFRIMQYDLDDAKLAALDEFRRRCIIHGLVPK
ncbi:MAG: menaquinone biosynthetic enzyme MqnA/MqnD family protein [Chthonomonadales bacterium]